MQYLIFVTGDHHGSHVYAPNMMQAVRLFRSHYNGERVRYVHTHHLVGLPKRVRYSRILNTYRHAS
jgi:hypothetical protein